MSYHRIFICYPYVGKSTLINCLTNSALFKSGVSTNKDANANLLPSTEHNGIRYTEISIKNESKSIKVAADTINKVLEKNVRLQIFFVVTVKYREIRPKHLEAISLVLQKTGNISHNLIINKLSKSMFEKLCENPTSSDGNNMQTVPSLLLMHDDDLYEIGNTYKELKNLKDFVESIKYLERNPANTSDKQGKYVSLDMW